MPAPSPAPRRIFIVPYRDRQAHRRELVECLNTFLEGEDDWEVFFIHQRDRRPFNRGAMKNIGFLVMRERYPDHYSDITFIFHDVDTRPRHRGQFPYQTVPGVVAHYHGVRFALGGAFAIKGRDFERTGGFPNFWGWGFEDNVMQDRCEAAGLRIDRSHFFPVRHPGVARPFDGYERSTSKHEAAVYKFGNPDNMRGIRDLRVVRGSAAGMIDVLSFSVAERHDQQTYDTLDIRGGTRIRAERRHVGPPPRTRPRLPPHCGARLPPPPAPVFRGRKRIKRPLSGLVRRWPPR